MQKYLLIIISVFHLLNIVPGFGQEMLELQARRQVKSGTGFTETITDVKWPAKSTAIIVCDMWDQHWCATATERVDEMAQRMNEVIKSARSKGVTIIHAPSSTMEYYKGYPQRIKMTQNQAVPSSANIPDWCYLDEHAEDPLPIDDSDGGCDDPASDCVHCEVWSKQIEAIEIWENDCISDSGKEINNFLVANKINHIIIMGVHINMCVLGRSFGIRSQVNLGRDVVLVRDLTDSMYNPEMHPQVSHSEGTNLVINHIEKFWCPSIKSGQLLD
ncbi:MAG: isochorismatase family protein [Saprospiraceae bacterium]|nr:isochorismatase family protein [Saprospiraceae bacterium]